MPSSGLTLIGFGFLATAAALAQTAAAQTKMFNTSTGYQLELPAVSTIESCAQIQAIMDRIDATNYRLGSPDSVKHPDDRQLLMYEDALSEYSYKKCQKRQPQGFFGGARIMESSQ